MPAADEKASASVGAAMDAIYTSVAKRPRRNLDRPFEFSVASPVGHLCELVAMCLDAMAGKMRGNLGPVFWLHRPLVMASVRDWRVYCRVLPITKR